MDRDTQLIKSLEELKDLNLRTESITAIKHIPSREGQYEDYPDDIHSDLIQAFQKKGFSKLYSHQFKTWKILQQGKNTAIVTPTASGKTLCYNLPVLDTILKNPSTRALYLFPTKALAQDQRAELDETIELLGAEIRIFTYDGDTPQDARKAIRSRGHIILTNPDMLHTAILPHHTKWIKLFENLKYVVIDELHNYRGIFGSHLANILRRLKRIAVFYGSSPRFILSTATIGNPLDIAEKIIEEPVTLIDENGAPRGEKYFIFYNPPVVNKHLGIRSSYINETRRLSRIFLKNNLQTIVFAQSRLITEILLTYLKDDIEKNVKQEGLIRGYRGGYLPLKRREIEKNLREGNILGVISTNALELGIDIGNLDVAVMAGYPGTISSTWQRAGRAGRKAGKSAALLIANSSPLNQFIINHPDYFFTKNPEKALINPDNLSILISHIECASFELPFVDGEKFGQTDIKDILAFLEDEGYLHHSQDKWYWTSDAYPADGVSLRSVSSDNFVVVDITGKNKVIAEVDFTSALTTLHPKAIYICEGEQYFVENLDFEQRKAYVKKTETNYYTDAIDYTKIKILDEFDKKNLNKYTTSHGEVHVATQVVGFKKIKFHTSENVGAGDLSLPQNEMHTTAFWITIPAEVLQSIAYPPEQKVNGIFGLIYCLHHVSPLFMMCDLHDIGVSVGDNSTGKSVPPRDLRTKNGYEEEKKIFSSESFEPNLFIYDNFPGGIGLSPSLFDLETKLLDYCKKTISSCPCKDGCPSCVGPVRQSGLEAKEVALKILNILS
ncbi:MAG: DEAD/DEAH box helicase [Candidatus Aminicenantes bacterium]|nr:DEAD/DEAH box helicase [Candidatus Aminicenantes bacterium]